MLDQGRRRKGGGDPYDAAGRRVVAVLALVGVLLGAIALRAGYLAARALEWPPIPVALACAVVALALPAVTAWLLSRDR